MAAVISFPVPPQSDDALLQRLYELSLCDQCGSAEYQALDAEVNRRLRGWTDQLRETDEPAATPLASVRR